MVDARPQRIRDPIHDLIEFDGGQFEQVCWSTIQTSAFQRLRRIKQLGFSEFVYPGATHSRFAHSLGVFHTARGLARVVERILGRDGYDNQRALEAICAALVHDVGHGPFSHSFEDALKRLGHGRRHELRTVEIVERTELREKLDAFKPGFASRVASIIKSESPADIYAAIVSSQFDADRLDYMRRDRLMSGTQHAAIDFQWLLANLDVKRVRRGQDDAALTEAETLVLGPKAVMAAEAYVLGLFQLYPSVYLHKTTRGAEKLFSELVFRVGSLVREQAVPRLNLPGNHPLVTFLRDPDRLEAFLRLDDATIWGALPQLRDAADAPVAELASRLLDRRFYKAIDVTTAAGEVDLAVKPRQAAIRDRLRESGLEHGTGSLPMVLSDVAVRDPYKQQGQSAAGLGRIWVAAPSGELRDLAEESAVVAALKPFHRYRIYVRDQEARDRVMKIIEETEK